MWDSGTGFSGLQEHSGVVLFKGWPSEKQRQILLNQQLWRWSQQNGVPMRNIHWRNSDDSERNRNHKVTPSRFPDFLCLSRGKTSSGASILTRIGGICWAAAVGPAVVFLGPWCKCKGRFHVFKSVQDCVVAELHTTFYWKWPVGRVVACYKETTKRRKNLIEFYQRLPRDKYAQWKRSHGLTYVLGNTYLHEDIFKDKICKIILEIHINRWIINFDDRK